MRTHRRTGLVALHFAKARGLALEVAKEVEARAADVAGRDNFDLLDANWDRWFPNVMRHDENGFTRQATGYGGLVVPLFSGNTIIFSRGFVREVRFSTTRSFMHHAQLGYWGEQPVTEVRLFDKLPRVCELSETWSWAFRHIGQPLSPRTYVLPGEFSKGILEHRLNKNAYLGGLLFESAVDAATAASEVAVNYGRSRAGLSPLTPAVA